MRIEVELSDVQYDWLERMLRWRVGSQNASRGDVARAEDVLAALRDAHAEALRREPA